jgi:hypothetical protein
MKKRIPEDILDPFDTTEYPISGFYFQETDYLLKIWEVSVLKKVKRRFACQQHTYYEVKRGAVVFNSRIRVAKHKGAFATKDVVIVPSHAVALSVPDFISHLKIWLEKHSTQLRMGHHRIESQINWHIKKVEKYQQQIETEQNELKKLTGLVSELILEMKE